MKFFSNYYHIFYCFYIFLYCSVISDWVVGFSAAGWDPKCKWIFSFFVSGLLHKVYCWVTCGGEESESGNGKNPKNLGQWHSKKKGKRSSGKWTQVWWHVLFIECWCYVMQIASSWRGPRDRFLWCLSTAFSYKLQPLLFSSRQQPEPSSDHSRHQKSCLMITSSIIFALNSKIIRQVKEDNV